MKANEPAFSGNKPKLGVDTRGLTVRDYIAIKAMQGALADPRANPSKDNVRQFCAGMYMIADAMIAESEKSI